MTNKLAIIGGSGLYDVEEFKDRELLDINTPWGKPSDQILKTKFKEKDVFALTVNGDSMIDANIADGDTVLIEPVKDQYSIRNGTIVSALVPGAGTTLKYFHRKGSEVVLEAANPNYDPLVISFDQVVVQGKLIAIWRKI